MWVAACCVLDCRRGAVGWLRYPGCRASHVHRARTGRRLGVGLSRSVLSATHAGYPGRSIPRCVSGDHTRASAGGSNFAIGGYRGRTAIPEPGAAWETPRYWNVCPVDWRLRIQRAGDELGRECSERLRGVARASCVLGMRSRTGISPSADCEGATTAPDGCRPAGKGQTRMTVRLALSPLWVQLHASIAIWWAMGSLALALWRSGGQLPRFFGPIPRSSS